MKKIIVFLAAALVISFANAQITTFPYFEDFEAGAGGWTVVDSGNSSWVLGLPQKTTINSAASGVNSWVTNDTGTYNANEKSYILSPYFDFSELTAPLIELKVWWDAEDTWDGAVLQSSVDSGATWAYVGNTGDPFNWFNNETDAFYDWFDGVEPWFIDGRSWTGETGSGAESGGWVTAKHDLTGLNGENDVLFRIVFASGSSGQFDGFAFDDVNIFEIPANDIGVISIDAPSKYNCGASTADIITISVKNFGSSVQSNVPVSYRIDGGAIFNETITDTINTGETVTYTFTTPADLSVTGTYAIKSWSGLGDDADNANDTSATLTFSSETITSLTWFNGLENDSASLTGHYLIENAESNVFVDTAAAKDSNFGLILDGGSGFFLPPSGGNEWDINPDNFAAFYLCVEPDTSINTMLLQFNLKQVYNNDTNFTNFRITVNGNQIGSTYNPPGSTSPWDTITIDLTTYLGSGAFTIVFESSCKLVHDLGGVDGNGNYVDNIYLYVKPIPTLLGDTVNFCSGDSVLVDAGNPGSSYLWSNGAATQETYISTPGLHTVTITNLLGSTADSVFAEVANLPSANFITTIDTLSVSFIDSSMYADSYSWDFGDGSLVDTNQNPSHTYAADSTYNVCLTATNSCGTDIFCDNITVTCPVPASGFTFTTSNLTASFTDSSIGATSWAWDFGDGTGTSTVQDTTYTYSTDSTYYVCLAVTNSCGNNATFCDSVTVTCPVPAAGFTFTTSNLTASFTDSSVGATSWAWDFGDGTGTSTAQDTTYTYSTDSTYYVCLTVTNSCGNVTFCDSVTVKDTTTGFASYGMVNENIFIFPNPNIGEFAISYNGFRNEKIELSIIDHLGRNIFEEKIIVNNNTIQKIDLSKHPKGTYFIKLKSRNGVVVKKVFVE